MGIIGTIQDLLHARLQAGQEGAPSPATGPDDRRGVVTPGPVDRIRPAAVDRTCSQAFVSEEWAKVIESMSANAAEVERVCDVVHAINGALDALDQAYARREHGGLAQSWCVDHIRCILADAGYRQ